MSSRGPLRILAVADLWEGSNGYAYVRAFRRLGHSVRVVAADGYIPTEWECVPLRALRRGLERTLVREYNEGLCRAAGELRPHLFFVYKGRHVTADTVKAIRADGAAVAVNVYPDVSFLAHGNHIPSALPAYDWIFQTKRFGLTDLERQLGVRHASFLPHAYDPEVHCPVELDDDDRRMYGCDVSFVGTWSTKKQAILEHVCRALPSMRIRVWGAQWETRCATLGDRIQQRGVHGREYAKALVSSRINLGLLSEARTGASNGDQVTSRTFHIPATGAFMLHERTEEFLEYFEEGSDSACFSSTDELVEKIRYFLAHDEERTSLAAAGRRRVIDGGHSIDCRAAAVLAQVDSLRASRVR